MDEHKEANGDSGHVDNAYKVFVSRIPQSFTEESVKRLIESKLGSSKDDDSVMIVNVGLNYVDEEEEKDDKKGASQTSSTTKEQEHREHKGFAFVQFKTTELASAAIALGSIKGGAKPSSTKKHRLYLSVVQDNDDDNEQDKKKNICFLWQNRRCPYGDACKFAHDGPGACLAQPKADGTNESSKKKKCWDFSKKGTCKLGDKCPFLHVPKTGTSETTNRSKETKSRRPDSEKDCINWKTKGKCRKGDKCPYRHDESLREKALAKKRKRQQNDGTTRADEESSSSRKKSHRQPLSVRVFGLNYNTTEADVRDFFADCGKITSITFPCFPDSGRSKGYCEVLFTSPKAVKEAEKLHETELHGRWLSIQAGKMYLKQWEEQQQGTTMDRSSKSRQPDDDDDDAGEVLVGEFGQKVKKRKKPRSMES